MEPSVDNGLPGNLNDLPPFALSQLGMGVVAFLIAAATWIFGLANHREDPISLMAAVASAFFLASGWATRNRSMAIQVSVFAVASSLVVAIYIGWRAALGTPLASSVYAILPVLVLLPVVRLRGALIATTMAMLWIIVTAATGLVVTSVDSFVGTATSIAFAGVVAFLLEAERRSSDRNVELAASKSSALESVLQSTSHAIFSVGTDGRVHLFNDAAQLWCEEFLPPRDGVQAFWTGFDEPLRSEFQQGVALALTQKQTSHTFESSSTGRVRTWEATFSPAVGATGATISIVDVGQIRSHALAMAATQRSARLEVLNLISHELNTPLMPVLLSSHTLLSRYTGDHPPELIEEVKRIERNTRRAIEMVGKLIDLGRELQEDLENEPTSIPGRGSSGRPSSRAGSAFRDAQARCEPDSAGTLTPKPAPRPPSDGETG